MLERIAPASNSSLLNVLIIFPSRRTVKVSHTSIISSRSCEIKITDLFSLRKRFIISYKISLPSWDKAVLVSSITKIWGCFITTFAISTSFLVWKSSCCISISPVISFTPIFFMTSVASAFIFLRLINPNLFLYLSVSARKIFSATVIPGIVPLSWTIIPIPLWSASIILRGFQSWFLNIILPLSHACIPATMEVMVDFPDPFSPINPRISPGYTESDTSFKATVLPNLLFMFSTFNIGSLMFITSSL